MAWLLRSSRPPKQKTLRPFTPEEGLWWSVLRQAAKDLDRGHRSEAVDAYEFLEVTGRWLAMTLFDIDPARYDRELNVRAAKRSGVLNTYLLPRSLGTQSRSLSRKD